MGRIDDPELQRLIALWSEVILRELDRIGQQHWPPFKEKRGLLGKPREIIPYSVEGPRLLGARVCWALSHVRKPSSFDLTGSLLPGERAFWLLALQPGDPASLTIEGSQTIHLALTAVEDLQEALNRASLAGPKVEDFYGNKGPLNHR